jgi:hypothetical protein
MKRSSILTICLIVISIGFLNAQTNQGKFLLGLSSDILNFGYTTYKTKSDAYESGEVSKSFNVNLSPKIGYFLIDNLAIGLDFGVGFIAHNFGSGDFNTTATISAGPFVRYYVPTSKVLPFIELGGSFGSMGNDNIINYGGGIGLAVPLVERVMVDFLAGYHSVTYKSRENNENNERTVMGTLGLNVGFIILLGSN